MIWPEPRQRKRARWGHTCAWLALAAMLFITVLPFLSMLGTAFEHPQHLVPAPDEVRGVSLLPHQATAVNFKRVMGGLTPEQDVALGGAGAEVNFVQAMGQSLLFTALVVLLQTSSCAMAAYAFARLRFPGRKLLFGAFLATMMVPGVVLLVPNFILVRDLGWLNTMAGMVAPFALMSGFAVFFLRQFFLAMPRDLEEAAKLDGATPFGIFWRVALPLNTTPLATIALLTGIGAWNEFFWPFIVSSGEGSQVLPVALQAFKAQSPQGQTDWTGLMAASTLALIPTVLLLALAARRVVESVQFSGGK